MNAILRHGTGADSTVLSLAFSPEGGHRQNDNLALYYSDTGRDVLGDLGYVGDMPVNRWIKSAQSHCLVVVDDSEQLFGGASPRTPSLNFMATSPKVSAVEAESKAYAQCGIYRRTVVLLKGPGSRTLAFDRFRVSGGGKHAYRLFSELASSDAAGSSIEFEGVTLPPKPLLPTVGSSLAAEDIFGLRDRREDASPSTEWTATWNEGENAYRLWMLSPCDAVAAANGPGQRSLNEAGRRVRYLEAIRTGDNLESDFITIHEPSNPDGTWSVRSVERLEVPEIAGVEAAAVRLETEWGDFVVLSDFAGEARVGDVTFQGRLGVVNEMKKGEGWLFSYGAGTLKQGGAGFAGSPPVWKSDVESNDEHSIVPKTAPPEGWANADPDVQSYLIAHDGSFQTGFPVARAGAERIEVTRFPLPAISEFELPGVRLIDVSAE